MSIQLLQANVLKRLAKNTKKTSRFTVDRILETKQKKPPNLNAYRTNLSVCECHKTETCFIQIYVSVK